MAPKTKKGFPIGAASDDAVRRLVQVVERLGNDSDAASASVSVPVPVSEQPMQTAVAFTVGKWLAVSIVWVIR